MEYSNRPIKHIVITGATGMIGSSLADYACHEGIGVTALVRPDSERRSNLPDSSFLQVVECDLSALKYADTLRMAICKKFGKCDAFFHLGWEKSSVGGRDDVVTQSKNIEYTLDAVKLADKTGCNVFVGAGSQAEYGKVNTPIDGETPTNPESGYGIAKYTAGKFSRMLCSQLGIRHCWARILSVYGEKDAEHTLIKYCINTLLNNEKPILTACEQEWDYIYSSDAANALFCIAKNGKDGAVYCVGSGKSRPLAEYVTVLRDTIDPALPLGFGERGYYDHQPMMLCADISQLTKDTGFVPEISFKEGIKRTVRSMCNVK